MNEPASPELAARSRSSALLVHAGGLHARPSIRLTQVARSFAARSWIGPGEDGPWLDAKSIALVMKLKTPAQARLHFLAEGADADDAVRALAQLVESDFAPPRAGAPRPSPPPLRLRGRSAAPGRARGPLVLLGEGAGAAPDRPASGGDEQARLRAAIAAAGAELAALMRRAGQTDAEDILAFQVAMLDDPVVTEPAFEAIAAGARAEQAWSGALELQLDDYAGAEDAYFRARVADLRDMRERVLRRLAGAAPAAVPSGAIVVAADLAPSRFLELAWDAGGIALFHGSPNSHVAVLARARGIPMLTGLEDGELRGHDDALLDADEGVLVASPEASSEAPGGYERRRPPEAPPRREPAPLLPGAPFAARAAAVQLRINVSDARELESVSAAACDGIGLVRTELLLRGAETLLDEQRQLDAYRRLIEWAAGRPVVVRTFDAGGDKPIDGYTKATEANPFLGVRGVRLALRHPQVLRTQLRALARAAASGPLGILVPMVTAPAEMTQVREQLDVAVAALRAEGRACAKPALGMMVEVPAAALTIERFDADFLSIGTNDLIQYLTGASRDSGELAVLQDPLQPAVLALLRRVVDQADSRGIPLSVCGDMAADPRCIPALVEIGVRCLSVAPAALARVRSALAGLGLAAGGGQIA